MTSLRFLSSSLCSSASFTIFSISSSLNPLEPVILISCALPVALSFAETVRIPFASMSKVTSICGIPRGAGGIPSKLKFPKDLLSRLNSRSPCKTFMVTALWLSSAVEKVCSFLVGIVVPFSMIFVITPPKVSMPSESGVTSSKSTSLTSPRITAPCIAAPMATTSSGFTLLFSSLLNAFFTSSCTSGTRVEPPTITISFTSSFFSPASFTTSLILLMVSLTIDSIILSNLARVIFFTRCFGPLASAVIKGKFTSVSVAELNSFFAFSAASFKRCKAITSFFKSMPCSFLNSLAKKSISLLSKSSPPKKALPPVASTSTTLSPVSSTVTSKVPPPRS